MTLWQVLVCVFVAWISGLLAGIGVRDLQRARRTAPEPPLHFRPPPRGEPAAAPSDPDPASVAADTQESLAALRLARARAAAVSQSGAGVAVRRAGGQKVIPSEAFDGFSARLKRRRGGGSQVAGVTAALGRPLRSGFGLLTYWFEILLAVGLISFVGWGLFYFAEHVRPPEVTRERQ